MTSTSVLAACASRTGKVYGSGLHADVCLALIAELTVLRQSMLERENTMATQLKRVAPHYQDSARNLVHYLALRGHELRPIQERLAWLGLSSLGRSESHVLANLDKVLGILHCLTGQDWVDQSPLEPAGSVTGRRLLRRHAVQLLGDHPAGRPVRIMVTIPSEAASDYSVVRELVDAGMDIARINCAHDCAADWIAMAHNIRRAAKAARRTVRILMDLGGPKIRTGDMAPRPAVLRMRPNKDEYGRPYRPYRLGIQTTAQSDKIPDIDGCIGVDPKWLAHVEMGTQIDFADARGAKRHLLVVETGAWGVVAESLQTAYLTPETLLTIHGAQGKKWSSTLPLRIDALPGMRVLHRGDVIRVTANAQGDPTQIACTLPEVIDQVRVGERIWFDDGRIGGVIRNITGDALEVEITQAREGGEKLTADKGINLPDSELDLAALTEKDLLDLQCAAQEADMVGLSFVQRPDDVYLLRDHLNQLGRSDMGIVLKIETIKGFENLPELMLAGMSGESAGVMIARGDLAVECGYERLAEVQEEILWCAEAAHMPVVWATQVLETLAKTGVPSRAEVSDAGLGVRAECVMLNKGPFITDAIRTLDDILRRMGSHQEKKRSLLRALHAWSGSTTPDADASPPRAPLQEA
ncbi:MAG: pyruvate kinase [Burkholderiales bacterium]|nr:pyruvate kinase [Burkholderiales bacterium]